jgi:hypothetical protein
MPAKKPSFLMNLLLMKGERHAPKVQDTDVTSKRKSSWIFPSIHLSVVLRPKVPNQLERIILEQLLLLLAWGKVGEVWA